MPAITSITSKTQIGTNVLMKIINIGLSVSRVAVCEVVKIGLFFRSASAIYTKQEKALYGEKIVTYIL